MTDRELMQMALDALEWCYDVTEWPANGNSPQDKAIEALRDRLAQPEPEPVAQMREMLEVQGRDGTWNCDQYLHGMFNGMEFMVALAEGRDPVFREAPERWLHTSPQREWQGLTDAEIDAAVKSCNTTDTYKYFRAIEAKLKEKNHG